MDTDIIKVFVSSTSEDLDAYRAVARLVILDMGWHPVMMEHAGASSLHTVPACLERVSQCDLMLLIVAFRRGWVPTAEQGGDGVDSITAFELRHAREHRIPVLAMFADDDWPGRLWEREGEAQQWIERFRGELDQPVVFFPHESDEALPTFRSRVRELLVGHREERLQRRSQILARGSGDLEHLDAACEGLRRGENIPFIGPGIYGEGPLSAEALARELAPELQHEDPSLATAAEYRERRLGSRANFLDQFAAIIKAQSERATASCLHELLARHCPPWLIVSTNFDRRLEEHFRREGIAHVVVAHILHSYNALHDGKILILRDGEDAEIRLADQVDLRDAEHVIYKPLGSPLLHSQLDEDLELDTVVVTETDHLTFLGRLEHEKMQIPTRFARRLQRKPLLFLGYTLDMWHYRLVMQVFQSVGGRPRQASTIAVRQPVSHMEGVAWQRLGADLIPMQLDAFVEHMVGAQPRA